MWPWGHLAFGYLWYSLGVHLLGRRAPTDRPVLALAVGTQLPDLVDKPLAWVFGVFPQGYALGHSVFVAVPVGLAVAALAARRDVPAVGAAFAVGYWSHLLGDVLLGVAVGEPSPLARVLWPVVTLPPYGTEFAPGGRVLYYAVRWATHLLESGEPQVLLVYLGPLAAAFLLWLVDGAPGLPPFERRRALPGRDD